MEDKKRRLFGKKSEDTTQPKTDDVSNTSPKDDEIVTKAYKLFEEYRSAYVSEWERLALNERLYQGRHWEDMQSQDTSLPEPMTPILHSTVENIAADLMDAYPEAIIQPETPEDRQVADIVMALIRQNHDSMGYRQEYRKLAHDLLVGGYMVNEVGYDVHANHNIGSAFIRHVDNRNMLFDPQTTDIQEGRAVFKIEPKTIEWLEQRYPDKKGLFAKDEYTLNEDNELLYDQTKSVLMLEYWYKEYDTEQQRTKVHMAKVAGRQLLEDSRKEKPDGYFYMGLYPFVVTPLFVRKGSSLGYGLCDMFGKTQEYADKLDQIILKNAAMASRNKLLNTAASGFDTEDLKDWSKDVHEGQSLSGVTWFSNPPLPNYLLAYVQEQHERIRNESGSNDFSRGQGGAGVTAASAIAALQEASSKRSRMASDQMHEAFKQAVRMEIEFEREFNILPREVLLTRNGEQVVATFENAILERESKIRHGEKVPVEFFVSIKVQRENRWTVAAHNELILQMAQLGILQPGQVLELMEFEGKEEIINKTQTQVTPEQMAQAEAEAQQQMAVEQAMEEQTMLEQEAAQLPSPEQALMQI